MYLHANAKLGLAARFALVQAVEAGCSIRDAARRFNVSPATAHRWWRRWLEAGVEARRTLSCLFDRSSRPHRSPRQLAPHVEEAICACRRATGWGPRLIAGATGFAHSTVWKVLRRAGISRPPRAIKEPPNRYEWPCPDSAADRPDRLRIVDVAPAVGFALEPELPPIAQQPKPIRLPPMVARPCTRPVLGTVVAVTWFRPAPLTTTSIHRPRFRLTQTYDCGFVFVLMTAVAARASARPRLIRTRVYLSSSPASRVRHRRPSRKERRGQ